MGLWKFIFGGLAAKSAVDRLNPPTIIFRNREYVCKGISPSVRRELGGLIRTLI